MLSDDDAGSAGARLPVALVSPSALALAGLRAVLAPERGFDVVVAATAWPPRAALAAAAVVVADAGTLLADGHDDAEGMGPATVLLVDRAAVRPALLARAADGASLVDREAPADVVAAAVRAAAAGLVCSTAALLRAALPSRTLASPVGAPLLEPLTAREREVLDQLSRGIGNREIAEALDISVHTAKFHVAQIIAKLGASSRAQALAKAARAGIVQF